MNVVVNVDGQDVFTSDVIHFLTMLSFHGKSTFSPTPGTVVVVHAETDSERITERTVITEDEDEQE